MAALLAAHRDAVRAGRLRLLAATLAEADGPVPGILPAAAPERWHPLPEAAAVASMPGMPWKAEGIAAAELARRLGRISRIYAGEVGQDSLAGLLRLLDPAPRVTAVAPLGTELAERLLRQGEGDLRMLRAAGAGRRWGQAPAMPVAVLRRRLLRAHPRAASGSGGSGAVQVLVGELVDNTDLPHAVPSPQDGSLRNGIA
jgi:hypothetical protein